MDSTRLLSMRFPAIFIASWPHISNLLSSEYGLGLTSIGVHQTRQVLPKLRHRADRSNASQCSRECCDTLEFNDHYLINLLWVCACACGSDQQSVLLNYLHCELIPWLQLNLYNPDHYHDKLLSWANNNNYGTRLDIELCTQWSRAQNSIPMTDEY